jgi:cytochrome P450
MNASYTNKSRFCCSLAWIEMRMIVVHLLRAFDLVGLEYESRDWIERQRIFFLWEKLPLRVRISAFDGLTNQADL